MAFLAPALPFIAAAGAIAQGVGGFMASQANKKSIMAQRRQDLAASRDEQLDARAAARKAIGAQLVAQSSNGMMGGTGTAQAALRESLVNAAIDVRRIREQGTSRAEQQRRQARIEERAGYFDLAAGLIGGATAMQGMQTDWAQARVGTSAGRGN
jgi:hypothetical protein